MKKLFFIIFGIIGLFWNLRPVWASEGLFVNEVGTTSPGVSYYQEFNVFTHAEFPTCADLPDWQTITKISVPLNATGASSIEVQMGIFNNGDYVGNHGSGSLDTEMSFAAAKSTNKVTVLNTGLAWYDFYFDNVSLSALCLENDNYLFRFNVARNFNANDLDSTYYDGLSGPLGLVTSFPAGANAEANAIIWGFTAYSAAEWYAEYLPAAYYQASSTATTSPSSIYNVGTGLIDAVLSPLITLLEDYATKFSVASATEIGLQLASSTNTVVGYGKAMFTFLGFGSAAFGFLIMAALALFLLLVIIKIIRTVLLK